MVLSRNSVSYVTSIQQYDNENKYKLKINNYDKQKIHSQ